MIKKRLREDDTVATQELSLVAALLAWIFLLSQLIERILKKLLSFFKYPRDSKAIQTFWDDTGIVSPKKYFYALREAKSRIYAEGWITK